MRAYVPRLGLALGVLATIVAMGAGAYAFGPSHDEVVADTIGALTTNGSGASASPGPVASRSGEPLGPSSPSAPSTPTAGPAPSPSKSAAGCPQGDRHREAETWLAQISGYGPIVVDGVQSPADCATIKKFQARFGISPANGKAGSTTADVARRIATSLTGAERASCGAGGGVTACIDLTLQTVWVVKDGTVVFGPTVVRTGMRGYATPAGTFAINDRNASEWSIKYKVWLPYWQHFTRGMGFHETTTYLHNGRVGSHGCVNLLRGDAKAMWTTIGYGTAVKVFGRRPGT